MADYFPLIANPVGNLITELPANNNLNLANSSIINAVSIQSVGNVTGTYFIGSGASLTAITGANVTGTVPAATIAATVTTAAQPNITSVGTLSSLAVTGNTSSGNFIGTLNGSGANVTSISATNISSGTLAQARLANASLTVNGTTIALGGSGTITATATNALTIGTGLSGTSYNGSGAVTITNTGVLSLTGGGGITVNAGTGSITLGSTATSANTAGAIVARGASGEFSAGVITATATSARYADLAEKYTADADYAPGTVLIFGGEQEVTASTADAQRQVVGVVSTNPAYVMNTDLEHNFVATVALTGRTPVKVIGPVSKGDFMVSAANGYARASADPKLGTVIGKAIEDFDGDTGVIEVLINNH